MMQTNTMSAAAWHRPGPDTARELAQMEGTCVTIYLAGHRGGSGTRPMAVRMRALVNQAERLLTERGVLPTDRETLLERFRALNEEPELGSGHAGSIAVFGNARRIERFGLPWEVEDHVSVEGSPRVTPLIEGLHANRRFLLLALSKKNTRLFECGPVTEQAVAMPEGVITNLEEFGGYDDPEQARGRAGSGLTFSLHAFADKEPLHLHDFFRALDRGLQSLLEERGLPLVLAGSVSELAAYREVNRYPHLAPMAYEGSPDAGLSDAELADRARPALKSWRPTDELHAVDLFLRAGMGKKSVEMEEILRESVAGRVMHLFLAGRGGQTGDVDRIAGRVLPSGSPRGTDDDLANAAAVETLRHGGAVWWIDDPLEQSVIAAALRW